MNKAHSQKRIQTLEDFIGEAAPFGAVPLGAVRHYLNIISAAVFHCSNERYGLEIIANYRLKIRASGSYGGKIFDAAQIMDPLGFGIGIRNKPAGEALD